MEKRLLEQLLKRIKVGALRVRLWDGSDKVYGSGKPSVTVEVRTPAIVRRAMVHGSVGFGEAYMDGQLEVTGSIDELLRVLNQNQSQFARWEPLKKLRRNQRNVRTRQPKLVSHHYDIGNDFYRLWLDKSLTYSCAYFKKPTDSLEQAQKQKVDYLLRKLQIKPGMRVLDIGSGWGTLMLKAAQDYGATGLGITLSQAQHKLSNERAKELGLQKQIRFELANYRDLKDERFDRIISVGMFEHVGQRNHASYFAAIKRMLEPGGLSVLHTITHETETKIPAWIDKYIFPGGYIPSVREIVGRLPDYDFRLLDYENLRMHYAMTLDEWLRRFEKNVDKVRAMYDERFVRMWRFYLAASSGAFRYSGTSLSQFVFSNGLVNDLPLTREFLYTDR